MQESLLKFHLIQNHNHEISLLEQAGPQEVTFSHNSTLQEVIIIQEMTLIHYRSIFAGISVKVPSDSGAQSWDQPVRKYFLRWRGWDTGRDVYPQCNTTGSKGGTTGSQLFRSSHNATLQEVILIQEMTLIHYCSIFSGISVKVPSDTRTQPWGQSVRKYFLRRRGRDTGSEPYPQCNTTGSYINTYFFCHFRNLC